MAKEEGLRLRDLAEAKFNESNLKAAIKYAKRASRLCPESDAFSAMLTSFKILRAASESRESAPEWYRILQVEPFCPVSTIKKQYRKLALLLHPDKNPHVGSEDAFKLVSEGFRFLSDNIRRKEYDMKLRIRLQDEKTKESEEFIWGDTFWTACSACRVLHQFDRNYLRHMLVCPSCKKSFEAVEIGDEDAGGEDGNDEGLKTTDSEGGVRITVSVPEGGNEEGNWSGGRLRRKRVIGVGEIVEQSRLNSVKSDDETMTLAEFQSQVKRKAREGKTRENLKEKKERENKENEKEKKDLKKRKNTESLNMEAPKKSSGSTLVKQRGLRDGDLDVMAVENSDFHDFDMDRVGKNFKKGHIWAVYDDDDGMPRHYALIDEVVSSNPFEVKISWLDLQRDNDKVLAFNNRTESRMSCGRFSVSKKTPVSSVNIFSHVVDSERAAKEAYRIYPKKGSVWAIYKNSTRSGEEIAVSDKEDNRCYDIVVLLTSYSEMYGVSMAYLEKVDGFKTIFKRREIGSHAILWVEKEIDLFSHQIPGKKLSGDEASQLSKDCWELDPASLPAGLLAC